MAGRSKFTEADRAKVYFALQASDFNVKATARETGFPVTTVRRWRDEFRDGINVPTEEAVTQVADAHVAKIDEVRDLTLTKIEDKLNSGEPLKLSELSTTFGILDDKSTRAKGLATSRVEGQIALPSREELSQALMSALQHGIEQATGRQQEIIDAEIVEPKALPPA